MKGWFDAFRNDGGPTIYSFNNRTAVTGDIALITIIVVFVTLYVAFLIIFPGIRKEKFNTFWAVSLSLFVGGIILVTIYGSCWHVAETTILGTYTAFSTEKISAKIGTYVGLNHLNITWQATSVNNTSTSSLHDIDYNERFYMINSKQMKDNYRDALVRGLPFPILTVAAYFTIGQEGLDWGSQYRAAGYFATILLWVSFTSWLLMNLMLVVVPRYGALLMTACGFLLLITVCGYFGMLPETPLVIHIEGQILNFKFGWCYWLVLVAGATSLTAGVIFTTIEIINPHSFSTILEIDYDTPYDRHVIIEESKGRKYQKKKTSNSRLEELESIEANGIGHKILRRLSSKQKDKLQSNNINVNNIAEQQTNDHHHHHRPSHHSIGNSNWGYSSKNSKQGHNDDVITMYSLHESTSPNLRSPYSNKNDLQTFQKNQQPMW